MTEWTYQDTLSLKGKCQRKICDKEMQNTVVTLLSLFEKTCSHDCTRVVRYVYKCKKDKKQKTWCIRIWWRNPFRPQCWSQVDSMTSWRCHVASITLCDRRDSEITFIDEELKKWWLRGCFCQIAVIWYSNFEQRRNSEMKTCD